jgi:hypothetical protein
MLGAQQQCITAMTGKKQESLSLALSQKSRHHFFFSVKQAAPL